jgi:hypothetical protein
MPRPNDTTDIKEMEDRNYMVLRAVDTLLLTLYEIAHATEISYI